MLKINKLHKSYPIGDSSLHVLKGINLEVETGEMVGTHRYGVGFVVNSIGERMGYESHPTSIPNGTKMKRSVEGFDDEDFSSLRNNRMSDLYEELGDEIDMSNLPYEIKDFVLSKSQKIDRIKTMQTIDFKQWKTIE